MMVLAMALGQRRLLGLVPVPAPVLDRAWAQALVVEPGRAEHRTLSYGLAQGQGQWQWQEEAVL